MLLQKNLLQTMLWTKGRRGQNKNWKSGVFASDSESEFHEWWSAGLGVHTVKCQSWPSIYCQHLWTGSSGDVSTHFLCRTSKKLQSAPGKPQNLTVLCISSATNRRFPEITGKDNLTVFSYSGRVKSPEWRRQLRRADLWQFRSSGTGLL